MLLLLLRNFDVSGICARCVFCIPAWTCSATFLLLCPFFFLRIQTLESICQLNDTVCDGTNCIFRLSFWFGMWAVWQLVSVGCSWTWVSACCGPLRVCLLFSKELQQSSKSETVHAGSGSGSYLKILAQNSKVFPSQHSLWLLVLRVTLWNLTSERTH